MPERESNITKKILTELRKIPHSHWLKTQGHMMNPGEPDISGCINGIRVEIEVKVEGNKSTPKQRVRQGLWSEAGAIVLADVSSWDEVRARLRAALSIRGIGAGDQAG